MARIEPLTSDTATSVDVAALVEQTADVYGDTAFYGVMGRQPALLKRLIDLLGAFPQSEGIDGTLLELMRLKVADVHRCAHCGTVRVRDVRDDVAPKEAAVLGELDETALSDREAAAVHLAAYMSWDAHAISDDFFHELRACFIKKEVTELPLFLSLEVGFDRFCIALQLDTTDDSPYPGELDYPMDETSARDAAWPPMK
jgi:hypothetical protein